MADLRNSQRTLLKATYVPIRASDRKSDGDGPPAPTRAMEKTSFVRRLAPTATELEAVARRPGIEEMIADVSHVDDGRFGSRVVSIPLIDVVRGLTENATPASTAHFAPALMYVAPGALASFGRAIAEVRRTDIEATRRDTERLMAKFAEARPEARNTVLNAMRWGLARGVPMAANLERRSLERRVFVADTMMRSSSRETIWGEVESEVPAPDPVATTLALIDGFLDEFTVEPVGRLHLERMEMTPVGIEHGELVYSVPLTPKETVNLSHREWSVTTQTFENIVQDYFEGVSELGVTEKTDLSHATANETRHSSSLDVNGSVTAAYQGGGFSVTASAGVDYSTKSDDLKSVKDSLAHSQAMTKLASSRVRKDHKVSFRVSSVAGAEDLAVRTITNPTVDAIRVDYFRLMRKWRVHLIRYGLRMTYDLVVPNPGSDLAAKVMELKSLRDLLAKEIEFTTTLADVTLQDWDDLAQGYGTVVDPPPTNPLQFMRTGVLQKSIDVMTFATVEFDVPDGYRIKGGHFTATVHIGDGDFNSGHRAQVSLHGESSSGEFQQKDGQYDRDLTAGSIVGRTGNVALGYRYYNVESGGYVATLEAEPTDELIQAWRVRVWNQLRGAAHANHDAMRARMQEQITKLEAEIAGFDALTLRRMEREEIMKSVLQWMLGPTFAVRPGTLDALLTDPAGVVFGISSEKNWQAIMQYGAFIRFIHNAIEWENVIYFAYPYFWDSSQRWPFKRFLLHPDPEHRSFLRAGCARVVLTVRPGFEEEFAHLLETGSFKGIIGSSSPYVTIGEEIRNYALTNYGGIPPANPDHNVRYLLYPEQRKAWSDMQVIIKLLEDHHTAHGAYPTTAQALAALNAPLGTSFVDPWGRDYVYRSPGLRGEYELVSHGADGQPDGVGLDADITSWAEGSVVAEWFEYTPTGALDVQIDTSLVTKPAPA